MSRQPTRAREGRAAARRRLDAELVRRRIFASRAEAQEAIEAGGVLVGGVVADKAARQVAAGEPIELSGPPRRFVGRGGEKLDAALEQFAISVEGRRALDAGASTGGFTDCLLQRGALEVTAVDVGHGQLHERLRADSRVTVLERTNVRNLVIEPPFELVVGDLSFISLRTVASALVDRLAAPAGDVVLLVKPQFEAGRAEASRGGGVIRDPAIWERVLLEVCSALVAEGAVMMGAMMSPLTGADGNVEFLVHLRAHDAGPGPAVDLRAVVAGAAGLQGV